MIYCDSFLRAIADCFARLSHPQGVRPSVRLSHLGTVSKRCKLKSHKKFELMLTRRAKAYSSSSSQTVSLSPAFSSQFILGFCAAAEDCKNY